MGPYGDLTYEQPPATLQPVHAVIFGLLSATVAQLFKERLGRLYRSPLAESSTATAGLTHVAV
jgi:hypothetical protein